MALITYADKQAMGTQPSIPNVNKVTDSDMNQIKYAINDSTSYSNTEEVVGTWIDGKPIYRKVITHTISDTTATNVTIATNISNMETLVNARGVGNFIFESNKIAMPLTFYNSGGWNSYHVIQNGTNITYQKAENWPVTELHFILEYTKTTD